MKVTISNNVLMVETGIEVSAMGKSRKMVREATKEKPAYEVSMGTAPQLSKFAIVCNSIIDGKAAVTIIMPAEVENDDYKQYVKDTYGDALLAAQACNELATAAKAKNEALEAIFSAPVQNA